VCHDRNRFEHNFLTRSVKPVFDLLEDVRAAQRDAELLAVPEGGDGAVGRVELHEKGVKRTGLGNVGQVAQPKSMGLQIRRGYVACGMLKQNAKTSLA
jgi:hypothetical protein